jgi:hypothetical protein
MRTGAGCQRCHHPGVLQVRELANAELDEGEEQVAECRAILAAWGATAHSGLSRTRLYYAPIDMATLQNVFHRISCARINRRNRRNGPCMETIIDTPDLMLRA